MNDSKFYRFLKTLNTKELRKFRKYLESPYFNTNQILLQLFGIFESHLLDPNENELDKKQVWELIYPNDPFDYDRLRKLIHLLMVLGEDFLAQLAYDDNSAHRVHYLLQMLHRKEMEEFIQSTIQAGINVLKKENNRNGNYYYDLYSIEKYKYILENIESARVKKLNIQKLNISEIDGHLNHFYFSEKLKYYCLLLSWSKMINVELNVPLIPEITTIVKMGNYLQIPSIAIYYQIYLTYIEPNELEHFYELKKLIKNYIHLFPSEDAKDIMNSAINYTIQKHNSGNTSFYLENFLIYKDAIEKEIILANNELSPWAFKNIITLGLRLNEFEWVQNFINNYGIKINKEYRENAINYNLASMYFYKKEYNKAIPLLQRVQFDETTYGLGAKSLLLACYYELDEFEALQSFYDSFKIFVNRNKSITDERKKSYLQLIKLTKKLTENNDNKLKLTHLKTEILESQATSKSWLLEKVDELLN